LYNYIKYNIHDKNPCLQPSVLLRTLLRVIEFNLTVIINY